MKNALGECIESRISDTSTREQWTVNSHFIRKIFWICLKWKSFTNSTRIPSSLYNVHIALVTRQASSFIFQITSIRFRKRLNNIQNLCLLHTFQFILLLTNIHSLWGCFQSLDSLHTFMWRISFRNLLAFVDAYKIFTWTFYNMRSPTKTLTHNECRPTTMSVVSFVHYTILGRMISAQHSMSDMTFIHFIASLINISNNFRISTFKMRFLS